MDLPRGQFDPALNVPAIDQLAGGRALAWIDDMLTPKAFDWAQARPVPTLLIPIDPAVGLTHRHLLKLLGWATKLRNTED